MPWRGMNRISEHVHTCVPLVERLTQHLQARMGSLACGPVSHHQGWPGW